MGTAGMQSPPPEAAVRLLTTEEFMKRPEGRQGGYELEFGRIVGKPMPNRVHGEVALNIGTALKL